VRASFRVQQLDLFAPDLEAPSGSAEQDCRGLVSDPVAAWDRLAAESGVESTAAFAQLPQPFPRRQCRREPQF